MSSREQEFREFAESRAGRCTEAPTCSAAEYRCAPRGRTRSNSRRNGHRAGSRHRTAGPAPAGPAPSAQLIEARTVAAISSATSDSLLQTVVTTADGVSRHTIDGPDQATEEVYKNSAGQTTSETAMRQDAGAPRSFQILTIGGGELPAERARVAVLVLRRSLRGSPQAACRGRQRAVPGLVGPGLRSAPGRSPPAAGGRIYDVAADLL